MRDVWGFETGPDGIAYMTELHIPASRYQLTDADLIAEWGAFERVIDRRVPTADRFDALRRLHQSEMFNDAQVAEIIRRICEGR